MRYRTRALALLALCLMSHSALLAADLRDPRTGGARGGPVAVLFLSWQPRLDATYAKRLSERGFVYANVSYFQPLSPDFLKQFNVFVLDEVLPAGYDYHPGAPHFRRNLAQILKHVESGAGLLTYAAYDASHVAGWNEAMKPYGVAAKHCGVIDPSTGGLAPWKAYVENSYGWTKDLNQQHPVTSGLGRIYYAMGELNGTGTFPAVPLVCDGNWTPLVRTMGGAHLVTFHPPVGELWYETARPASYPLCAVRQVGKGRACAFAVTPEFTHREGYGQGQTAYELSLGRQDGRTLETGDGTVRSDAGEMLMRLYAWLAADSVAAGLGGYKQGDRVRLIDPPPAPAQAGPRRSFRALIGARSKYSDGAGDVRDYARAAKQAGYSLLVFTENFKRLDPARWDEFAADCAEQSGDDLIVLPGFEIEDVEGGRFLHIAPPRYPHPAWLSGKRLVNPYTPNFYYYRHCIVVHRPDSSPIPVERLKHFHGLSVYTYRGAKLVDNSLHAFQWQVQSASFPVPFVVHEVLKPEEIAEAARTGFQQYLPETDTLADAVARFCRTGFNNVEHVQISEGPRIANLDEGIVTKLPDPRYPAKDKAQQSFQLNVAVSGETPLKTVTLYDGFTPVRRWLTGDKEFKATASFPFSHEYGFSVIAEDARGRRALRSMWWISPARTPGHFRCTDRQNWLGHLPMYYTGAFLPFGHAWNALRMPIRGTDEGCGVFSQTPGASMAAKFNLPFTCNDVVLTEYVLDEKYVSATFNEVGLAAMPSRASKVSSVYAGRVRHYSFTQSHESEPWVALVEYDLTLKRAVEPLDSDGLFPAVDAVRGDALCRSDGKGGFVVGKLDPKDRARKVPVPRGSLGGGIIPLDDGWAILDGRIGRELPASPDFLPAGTRLSGRFLMAARSNQVGSYDKVSRSFETAPETWLRAMGFAGGPPYRIVLTRGELGPIAFMAHAKPDRTGVAGEVRQAANVPYDVPLCIRDLNPRWVAGSWRAGGKVTFTGVYEDTAWPRLDVSQAGAFYAGNLVTADNPRLTLSLARWDADAVVIEAHNPTQAAIEATIATPTEITGYKAFRRKVVVPAGATVYLNEE